MSHIRPDINNPIFANYNSLELFFLDASITAIGQLGNIIFIAISATYLSNNNIVKPQKVISIFINNILICWLSVLACFCVDKTLNTQFLPITPFDWVKQCGFPIILGTYWFMLPYILLYIFHPLINALLNSINKKTHLCISIFLMLFVGFILRFGRGSDDFIGFLTVYVFVSYFNKYPTKLHKNILFNVLLIIISLTLMYLFIYIIHPWYDNGSFSNPPSLAFVNYASVFMLCVGIGLLNVFSSFKIKNKIITNLSSLSLLTYLIGSDIFLTRITRYLYFDKFLYIQYGFNYIIGWWILGSLCYFILTIGICIIYSSITQKLINKTSDFIASFFTKLFNKIDN